MGNADDGGLEGSANFYHYKGQKKNAEEEKQILNIKNKIKETVDKGRKNDKGSSHTKELSASPDQEHKIGKAHFDNRKASNVSASHRSRSILLSKLATQKKIKDDFDNREYRLVTGSDDGYVFFWNLPYDFINEAKAHQALLAGDRRPHRQSTLVKRGTTNKYIGAGQSSQARKIPEIKAKYELYLSGYA